MVPGTGRNSWEEGLGEGQGVMAEHLGEGPPLLQTKAVLVTPSCFSFRGLSPSYPHSFFPFSLLARHP